MKVLNPFVREINNRDFQRMDPSCPYGNRAESGIVRRAVARAQIAGRLVVVRSYVVELQNLLVVVVGVERM